jgi:hypothetical protein
MLKETQGKIEHVEMKDVSRPSILSENTFY